MVPILWMRETEAQRCPANTCLGAMRASHTAPMCSLQGTSPALWDPKRGQHPRMQYAVPSLGSLQITTNPNCQGLGQTLERDVPEPGTTWLHQDRRTGSHPSPPPNPGHTPTHPPKGPIKQMDRTHQAWWSHPRCYSTGTVGRAGGSRRRPLTQQMNLLRHSHSWGRRVSHRGGQWAKAETVSADAMSPLW